MNTITVDNREYTLCGLDFETYWDDEYTLRKLTTTEYLRDKRFLVQGVAMQNSGSPYWVSPHAIDQHFSTIDWSNTAVVCHHAHFDCAILAWHYGIRPGLIIDTLSMGRALFKGYSKASLAELAKFFKLKNKMEDVIQQTKSLRILPAAIEAKLAIYACTDVELAMLLYGKMKSAFPEEELIVVDTTVRMYTEPVLRLDKKLMAEQLKNEQNEKAELIRKAGFTDIEKGMDALQSADRFADLLRAKGVEPPMKWSEKKQEDTYAFSKQDEALLELLNSEEVGDLVKARLRVKSTLAESRAKRFLDLAQGNKPVPVYLAAYAAHTNRWGGGDKTNFQNLSRKGHLRKGIMAPPRHVLVVGDESQIEARLTAYVAGQQDVLEAFADPTRDPYKELACDIYRKPVDLITKEERFVGKVGTLSLGFKVGPKKYQHTLAVGAMGPPVYFDLDECTRHVNVYRNSKRQIRELWNTADSILASMVRGGKGEFKMLRWDGERMYLPNGLYLAYPELGFYEFEEQDGRKNIQVGYRNREGVTRLYDGKLVENFIQALARIVVSSAMVKLRKRGYRSVLTVHDELVLSVPTREAAQAAAILEEELTRPVSWAPGLPLACEVGTHKRYGMAK